MIGCALSVLSHSPASAQQPTTGPYVSLGAGAQWLNDAKTSGAGVNTKYRYETGPLVIGALGYGFGNGIRVEGELGYRHSDVKSASTGTATGATNATDLMLNGLYDFNLGWPVTPYVGVGVGGARVRYDSVTIPGGSNMIKDSDTDFAYQGIAGVAYAVNENLKIDLGYRYFATTNPSVNTSTGTGVTSHYSDNAVLLSLRWEFGAAPAPKAQPAAAVTPPPPPAVAAAPAPRAIQRSYLVFFDFDKSTITDEANRVIQQAATNAKAGNVSRIQATGHADRAGPDAYNMALSIRRANAVKAVLVGQGIPENEIVVIGKGETEPLVPTPDGVREPQNRRVEILLQ